jgi:hypothetical protein
MAQADCEISTQWISLGEALALFVEVYGSPRRSGELLVEALGKGQVRWCCRLLEGGHTLEEAAALKREARAAGLAILYADSVYREGDPAFWRAGPETNFDESWAREKYVIDGSAAYGIQVAREDVEALLPAKPPVLKGFGGAKSWITIKARQLKAAGKIRADITKADFARLLADRMREAAGTDPSVRPITARSIANKLAEWGLWPISKIK